CGTGREQQAEGVRSVETGLPDWACRIRTGESACKPTDWNYVTTSFEVGASRAAETLGVRAASNGFCSFGQKLTDELEVNAEEDPAVQLVVCCPSRSLPYKPSRDRIKRLRTRAHSRTI